MSDPLKPQFFVLRQNGSIVPLIAMDELPHNIRVEAVPRTMTIEETVGMFNIGEHPSRHRYHHITDTNRSINLNPLSTQFDDTQDSKSDSESLPSPSLNRPTQVFPGPDKSYGIVEQRPSLPAETQPPLSHNISKPKLPPATKVSSAFGPFETLPPWKDSTKLGVRALVPGKKVYCTHWMSTGECDYAQQGCMYKHEMPFELAVLNSLGYQDIPKWYREKHGLGKLTATPGSGASVAGPGLQSAAAVALGAWRASAAAAGAVGGGGAGAGAARTQRRLTATPTPAPAPAPAPLSLQKRNPPRDTNTNTSKWRGPKSQNQSRDQTHLPKHALPRRPSPFIDPVPSNSLLASKFASTPDPSTSTSTSSPSLVPSSLSAHLEHHGGPGSASRRSSLYSDPEADFFRENQARQAIEAREYAICVEAERERKRGAAGKGKESESE